MAINYRAMFRNYPDALTPRQVQEMLGVGQRMTYGLLQSGRIQSVRMGIPHSPYIGRVGWIWRHIKGIAEVMLHAIHRLHQLRQSVSIDNIPQYSPGLRVQINFTAPAIFGADIFRRTERAHIPVAIPCGFVDLVFQDFILPAKIGGIFLIADAVDQFGQRLECKAC